MLERRQFFVVLGSALALGPVVVWLTRPAPAAASFRGTFPVQKTDDDWRRQLSRQQYRVLRGHATEGPYSSPLDREKRSGTFVCRLR